MASPGYRRCPQDTAYPQDTDSVLRIPRYPQDTAGVLRYNYRHDAAVSSGYRVPRMPSVSQDANSRFQTHASCATAHAVIATQAARREAISLRVERRWVPLALCPPRCERAAFGRSSVWRAPRG